MMACEEAYLAGQGHPRRSIPQAVLALGPVPTTGQNDVFKNSVNGKQTFVIQAEKVPNAAGVRRVLAMLGGPQASLERPARQRQSQGRLDRRRICQQLGDES